MKKQVGGNILAIVFLTNLFSAPAYSGSLGEESRGLLTNWIQDIAIVASDAPNVACPPSFTKIDADLNSGAAGKYIFLCYSKDGDSARPLATVVSSIKVNAVASSADPSPEAMAGGCARYQDKDETECREIYALPFASSNGDVNQGARGDYVYISKSIAYQACDIFSCIFSSWYDGYRVKEVRVVSGSSSGVACPRNYEKIPVNLNKNAGGSFIFICQLRAPYSGPP